MEFEPFPKLPRLNRGMVITEKIDGTNACVVIGPQGYYATNASEWGAHEAITSVDGHPIFAQSRRRLITVEGDNYGFARWVHEHAEELIQLGEGRHFGEWWGLGIQRGYEQDRKRFSLFNTSRWGHEESGLPECCDVVPTLAATNFSQERIDQELFLLGESGSRAAPGFMNPEGVVVYLSAARSMFKVTLENDGVPKSQVREAVAA